MLKASATILLLLALVGGNAPIGSADPAPDIRMISLTRVVRIPVQTQNPEIKEETAALLISPGAADELAEGPNGFDVLDDGSFLITDPLRSQVSVFDSEGKFKGAWKIGFAADSLTTSRGLIVVREATTEHLYVFDRDGKPHPQERGTLPKPQEARVVSATAGTVTTSAAGNTGTLSIQFDKPGLTLLSLESLGTDADGNTYVALEATTGSSVNGTINLTKYVRKYSAAGTLVCEAEDIPLDYYVPPVDELRVHGGVVYQLFITSSEVRINVWDTN
jgi:hypothetical protein